MAGRDLFGDGEIRLIVRCDDIGLNHATNQAFARVAREGIVTAASVMVTTPWLDEAVEILREHPALDTGVHVCLNSEWWPYRWGPVTPAGRVSSLVDEWGRFLPTRAAVMARSPDLDEAEREMRAQVAAAQCRGLTISYMDHHMLTIVADPGLRARFEAVGRSLGLALSGWFGERHGPAIYSAPPEKKAEVMIEGLRSLTEPGLYLVMAHPALDEPEMRALRDLNPDGLADVARHRQAEMEMLCDPRLREVIAERGIVLTGYTELRGRFLSHMATPALWRDLA